MTTVAVVFDAQLLINATAFAGSTWLDWPRIPPITSNPEADCLGVIASAEHFDKDVSLLISDRLLVQVVIGLREGVGLARRDVREYVHAVLALARASGGDAISGRGGQYPDLPDRFAVPLSLAQRFAAVTVAAERTLCAMGPRWGPHQVPVVSPDWFRRRADARRRASRG